MAVLATFIGTFIISAIEAVTVATGWMDFYNQLIYGLLIVFSVIMHPCPQKWME